MAVNPMTTVTFDGKSYDVPKDLLTADAQNGTSLAKQYIEDQVAEKTLRVQATQQRKQQTVEREFKDITAKLSEIDSLRSEQQNQAIAAASYQAANDALQATSGGITGAARRF